MLKEIVVDEAFIKEMNEYRKKPEGKGLLEACSKDVILFAEYMLGFKLYSWQIKFLKEVEKAINKSTDKRIYLALTSRQIGKSTAIAIFALWCCLFNKYPGTLFNNTIVGVVSASDTQSKKLLGEVKKFIHQGDRFINETYGEAMGPAPSKFVKGFFSKFIDEDMANNTTTISFKAYIPNYGEYLLKGSKSGSVIKSYPPTSVVLGETFTVNINDEAGKTDRISDEFHDEYIYPTGNSTDAVRIYTSTPWTPSGFFYRFADPMDEFGGTPAVRFLFTIDAIKLENPKYYADVMKTINQMNADGKTNEVQRAYYCRFVKGEKSYFDSANVNKMFAVEYGSVESYDGLCDLGLDYGGQVVSRSVITISKQDDNGEVYRIYKRVYNVGEDDDLLDDVNELKSRFNIQRIIPDDCPQGDFMNREMANRGWPVHPMNFRSEKVKKYGAFRSYLNKGKIHSFPDNELKTEMLALEFAEGSRQSLIQHAPGYTDDLIDSFVLSTYFMVEEEGSFQFHTYGDSD